MEDENGDLTLLILGGNKNGQVSDIKKARKISKNTLKAKPVVKPRLKVSAAAYDYSAASDLANRKFISAAIADALSDGDADAIREILVSHLEQVHRDQFFKDAGISRRTLFKLREPEREPYSGKPSKSLQGVS